MKGVVVTEALGEGDRAFFEANSYLRLSGVFGAAELAAMSQELDTFIDRFVVPHKGWDGAWREAYLSEEENERSVLSTAHEMELFSAALGRAILAPRIVNAVSGLIGPDVEFHHMTLHAKGPEYGTPFPLHQDYPFYPHSDGRYVLALVHIDHADEENGCIKFLPGSHREGPLPHVSEHGEAGHPHLPPEDYPFEKAVSCPAEAGDVVLFSIHSVHGSALNRTNSWRRLIRIGYRDPRNLQLRGQAYRRPGWMVAGTRPKIDGVTVLPYEPMKITRRSRSKTGAKAATAKANGAPGTGNGQGEN
jgi:phytanoyl-CoA hydroxylase